MSIYEKLVSKNLEGVKMKDFNYNLFNDVDYCDILTPLRGNIRGHVILAILYCIKMNIDLNDKYYIDSFIELFLDQFKCKEALYLMKKVNNERNYVMYDFLNLKLHTINSISKDNMKFLIKESCKSYGPNEVLLFQKAFFMDESLLEDINNVNLKNIEGLRYDFITYMFKNRKANLINLIEFLDNKKLLGYMAEKGFSLNSGILFHFVLKCVNVEILRDLCQIIPYSLNNKTIADWVIVSHSRIITLEHMVFLSELEGFDDFAKLNKETLLKLSSDEASRYIKSLI